ncbi:bis-aminopropyl spermidine synthase family protein [Planotetraspora phitsanulokensis]|uniref:Methyltransferase n=1 Tax=Planotetraspora phitsanulokensis TaxID=575192 RepID=A0A8J3TYK9_9ACTN|nr:bis-aminopropyl spermidine synthase family protein [Planotetraspora phitsanulokensis]GII35453.1 methyltransferase [Planotetraspora phitsanulokensis]
MTAHEAIDQLLTSAGVDSRRLRRALTLLSGGDWWTLADLVRETATSRRSIESLLRELPVERSGDRFRLPVDRASRYNGALGSDISDLADPVAALAGAHAETHERLAELIAKAPRGRHTLDHVSATADTVLRRALLLGTRFWLPGARLLCVGDHDLTSLAVRMLHPEVEVTVVDIDERILGYIDAQGLGVRTRWADLRLGLAPSARGQADLAITDPPYTPEGIGLFVARAAEGLRDRDHGRILLAYGASERTPMLALKVQNTLSDLNLLNEAIFPDFNRYDGAEAIGSAADLYILRPTTKTWPAVAARVDRLATAIYTQGPQSVEAASPEGAPAGEDAVAEFAPALLAGEWPRDLLPKVPRTRLSTLLAKPYAATPERVAVAVPAGLETALPRLLLATRAGHVRVLLAARPDDLSALTEAVRPVYDVTCRPADAGAVLDAVRLPPPDGAAARIVRRVLNSAHGKVANTWREALTETAGLTRKEARAAVEEAAPWARDLTALELPLHRLAGLAAAVSRTLP